MAGESAPLTEPQEGSPADWFARGYARGMVEGSGQAVREVVALEADIRAFAERVGMMIRGLQQAYGDVAHQPDRWQLHPMYLRGADLFAQRENADKPTMQQQWAAEQPEPEGPPKPKRGKVKRPKAELDTLPTLNLDMPEPAAVEASASLSEEQEMRRAAGHAWRA